MNAPLNFTRVESPQVYQRLLRRSLLLFMRDILGLLVSAEHIREWGGIVNAFDRVALTAARGHGKSAFWTYAYPIWRAWSEPGCTIYLFSASDGSAMEFLDHIIYGGDGLTGMVDIPALAHLVPTRETMRTDRSQRLNKRDVRFTNGSRIRTVGYGQKVRGRHPKYIILDDVLNDEDLFSETVREKNIHYFKSAIVNMVAKGGQIVNIGTPMHAADLHGFLAANSEFYSKRYPGILDYQGTNERALFPEIMTLRDLKRRKRTIGNVAFTREILVEPISNDLSLFPSYLFPPAYETQLRIRPSLEAIRARGWTTYMGVDIALSASVGADWFVIFVIGVDPKGNHHIVDIRRHRGLEFHLQLQEIERFALAYDCALVLIEAVMAQRVWSDEMKRTTDIPVKEFVTSASNKYPLDKGMPSLRILLENKKIRIPRGDALSIEITNLWIEEMVQFGFFNGKLQGTGAHDDQAMAFWFACEAKKLGAFGFAFGDDEEGEEEDDDEDWETTMLGPPEERAADARAQGLATIAR